MSVLAGAATPATAQTAATDVKVAFRPPVGYVGEEVRFPVYLEGSGADALRHLTFELGFPRELMSLVEIERGFLLRDHGASVEHRTEPRGDGRSALVLEIASEKGLPEGLLLYAKFRVASIAPPGGEIPLDISAKGNPAPPGTAAVDVPLTADPFRISPRKLENEFLFACFFYMH